MSSHHHLTRRWLLSIDVASAASVTAIADAELTVSSVERSERQELQPQQKAPTLR
ncbi:hypothetical protein SynRS9907_00524 [Synechococcus sp. RS9907]|nr:hypothetical protein SynRS9907_00524 [Synechococcus sp. RS9907]